MPFEADTAMGGAGRRFPSTRRSLIRAAGGGGAAAREALDAVIAVYWKPLYKYIRVKWNRGNEDAKDLVQGFFAALLQQDLLAKFDPSVASFRTYLRACADRFVMKQDESAGRLKRGGGVDLVTLDFDSAERELALAGRAESPEDLFHREWQRQIFSLAIDDLREACAAAGKDREFRIFEQYDLAETERPRYEDLAREHGVPVTGVTNALAWARRELRRFARQRAGAVLD
ncbi:MAG: sigma-70 family RNA polymerase sigma factor [Acidobacteriia bacterium]|nr:sigma-70 family RNA polymerase sigma factor [Terriglobia bacterium]